MCVRDLDRLGDDDPDHLACAARDGRVLVIADADFLRMAAIGIDHAGIIFGSLEAHTIGDWVKALEIICFVLEPEEMLNHVEFI
ncbi:MAG: hypothetical protein JXJ17_08625 [Anaerolineae bacterium]|nr:hypothetical protein [Anaerolineae bacterium]